MGGRTAHQTVAQTGYRKVSLSEALSATRLGCSTASNWDDEWAHKTEERWGLLLVNRTDLHSESRWVSRTGEEKEAQWGLR
jgi:hypothetical protein